MTIVNGWLSGAVKVPGIPDKVYSEPNAGLGIVCHSIEGASVNNSASPLDHIPDRFFSKDRVDGRYTDYAAASCMFINPFVGGLIQMYPIWMSTWTSGNRKANTTLWAVESEGRAGQPLNDNQVRNMLYLAEEWERHTGKSLWRGVNLLEHNEVALWATPNAGPTACPSGRYAPFYEQWAANTEPPPAGDPMTPEERAEFNTMKVRMTALEDFIFNLTGNAAVAASKSASKAGWRPLSSRVQTLEKDGDTVARTNINGHIANHTAQSGGGIPEHTHEGGKVARK